MSDYLIRTDNLVKAYGGRRVVDGVNLKVARGEIVGLLGPNGAGKTTTFYMVTGLVKPTSGRVLLETQDVTDLPMYRRARMGMGYLAQEPSIFRQLSVYDNVMAILETLPLDKAERRQRAEALLDDLRIRHVAKQAALTLSGGERRRLEIARALVTNPSLMLLDEPFAGVDPIARQDVQQMVLRLRERGLGVIITDHDAKAVLDIVDRAYLIYEGKVLREGDSQFLKNDPETRERYLGRTFDP
jgi:lipopolysaccharide export system ATP-binding protein